MPLLLGIGIAILALAGGGVGGYFICKEYQKKKIADAKLQSHQIIEDAKNEVKVLKKKLCLKPRKRL